MTSKISSRTRKRHSAEFKAKVVVAALREDQTLGQLGSHFGLHPMQVSAWKKQVLAGLPEVLGRKPDGTAQQTESLLAQLYEQIGRLEMENAWLKKKLGPLT